MKKAQEPAAPNGTVEIFTDGACKGNPGPGGWAALLRYKGVEKSIAGRASWTTNNRMEITAAIKALESLRRPCRVTIVTDSQYLKNGITQWIRKWKKNGWITSGKTPVKNEDLWRELDDLMTRHEIEWQWVRGHRNHHENQVVDKLAREAIGRKEG
jgi:ribonuclease HI